MNHSPEPVKPGDMAIKVKRGVCFGARKGIGKVIPGPLGTERYVVDYVGCGCCVWVLPRLEDKPTSTRITNLLKISPDPETEDMETREPVTDHA